MNTRTITLATQAFMASSPDTDDTIFLQLTQEEACLINLMGEIGMATLIKASRMASAGGYPDVVIEATDQLAQRAQAAQKDLWRKIAGAIRVQVFNSTE